MILGNCEIQGDPEGRNQALALIAEIRSKADLMEKLEEPVSADQVDPMAQEINALMGRLIRLMTWRVCDAPGTAELVLEMVGAVRRRMSAVWPPEGHRMVHGQRLQQRVCYGPCRCYRSGKGPNG